MNFNLLHPVVFANLKVGDVLQSCSAMTPTVAYRGSDFAVLRFGDGSEGCYEIHKLEANFKLMPLCWVEGKPVYPGDGPLYYEDNPAWRHNEEGVFASGVRDDELHFHGGIAFPITDATWTKPKQKRVPSFQVEGQDVFPGDPVYYYGGAKSKWGKEYTVETDNSVTRNNNQWPVKSFKNGAEAFRLKPMLVIGDHLVPMPVRNAAEMKKGDCYYIPCLDNGNRYLGYTWSNHSFDIEMCDKGLVHRTKEAASAHTRALLTLSKKKD